MINGYNYSYFDDIPVLEQWVENSISFHMYSVKKVFQEMYNSDSYLKTYYLDSFGGAYSSTMNNARDEMLTLNSFLPDIIKNIPIEDNIGFYNVFNYSVLHVYNDFKNSNESTRDTALLVTRIVKFALFYCLLLRKNEYNNEGMCDVYSCVKEELVENSLFDGKTVGDIVDISELYDISGNVPLSLIVNMVVE